ncbi:G2 M phase-specific E3 ubiquitin- ligase-like protein [Labeo rohita]|uniref:G2 M phase-specific E3 ubiquitin-ligase-like protein n=1 Tax=Labeo rohita TaxID=84645 RepID=A0A498MN27_LABRO|nr:G2 M phase-specific E3 ubiquitin- ligase-like protein [Labeo rohita]RXN37876.1 G2 M phase-specific E3 ubiquitin- ligase-like protein [Labeo rohita]
MLFTRLMNDLESANPTLDDIADIDLYEKIKKIGQSVNLNTKCSNKRVAEETVVPFWRDYLEDAEGSDKLRKTLAFAAGADAIQPIGFSPRPSIEFLHQDAPSTAKLLPIANSCIIALLLPSTQESVEFDLGNT